ncbi:HGGxSTG domain-containing protein [Paramagnetospirillum marisnigri]|uniref:HGGxSTG domain-containing protein n=1 Tax=Paramagnetospirillum marisnigri TaxID=1285242 RepID=UPI002AC34C37|nr:HGGxSTG domain-containing protein [Paramagnetospirillum marisnigri]
MSSPLPMHQSPRCGAKTRSGAPCQQPGMANGRCKLHGGKSTGAPKGKANGNYRHGYYTAEAIAERRELRTLIQECRESVKTVRERTD